MKRSLLNIAITMTLSGAIFSGAALPTLAYANDLLAGNTTSNDTATETYLYTGMGVGAASGALVAGPVGLLVGGLIGAFTGASQEVSNQPEVIANLTVKTADESPMLNNIQTVVGKNTTPQEATELNATQSTSQHGIQLAQSGEINTVVENSLASQQEALLKIITTDLSLDIYFRSGSTNIETFYPARLAAIAKLVNSMNQLELHLDGYTDRRGDKTKNIALANERIEKVREQLINAGVNEHRIISKAFGERKMISNPGDLDAYTFDRKVVIRFERSTADSISSMTTALSELETENDNAVVADTSIDF